MPPQALLFDLGGVLIEIDFARAFRAWQPISRLSLEEISWTFKFDAPYERHERGEIGDVLQLAEACRADNSTTTAIL